MPELQEGAAELTAQDPNFEAQSTEELGKTLDKMESEAAQEAPTSVMEGEKPAEQVEQPPKWFTEHREEMLRELKGLRGLNSLKDKIPSMVSEQIKRQQAENARNQQLQNLSPEDRQRLQDEGQQLEALNKLIAERAEAVVKDKFGDQLSFIKEESEKQNYLSGVAKAVGSEERFKELYPHFKSMFDAKIADIKSGNEAKAEAAEEWYKLATENVYFLVREAEQAQSKAVQGQAKQFADSRIQAGQEASQSPRSTAADFKGGKPVQEKTQAELDAMSTEELAIEFEKAEKAGKVSRR